MSGAPFTVLCAPGPIAASVWLASMSGIEFAVLAPIGTVAAIYIAAALDRIRMRRALYVTRPVQPTPPIAIEEAECSTVVQCANGDVKISIAAIPYVTFAWRIVQTAARAVLLTPFSRHPSERGRNRNRIRVFLRIKAKEYHRDKAVDLANVDCVDPGCPHPAYAVNFRNPLSPPIPLPPGAPPSFLRPVSISQFPQPGILHPHPQPESVTSPVHVASAPFPQHEATHLDSQLQGPVLHISGQPEALIEFFDGYRLRYQVHYGPGPQSFSGNQ